MIPMQMSLRPMPWGLMPLCETDPPYDQVGEFFTVGAGSSKADGFTRGHWACNKVAAGRGASQVEVGGSEAHAVIVARPNVRIERFYLPHTDDWTESIVQEVPFELFRDALGRWRAFVRAFEKGNGPGQAEG
jgi:hypothetical protein